MKILVTGGAGYIGSHMCAELLRLGHEIVVADNFSNGTQAALDGVKKISGSDFPFYETDIRDENALEKIFYEHKIDCVTHFAGLKAVGKSVSEPLEYYENNLNSTLTLCRTMRKHGVFRMIFSSSAATYSPENSVPLTEDSVLGATNPYGRTKIMCEEILRDLCIAEPRFSVVLLRYFNAVGAHESGLIGDCPRGIPNNLMPFISQTAAGLHSELKIFGNDYNTPDGTCIRDYIHITDLIDGHVCAIEFSAENAGCEVFNLGTGRGISVLEMVDAFDKTNGLKLPRSIAPRRPGDFPEAYASPEKAEKMLKFRAKKSLEDMCRDTWKFQRNVPSEMR
ncbi:MAG: UDP-glucose 4-epimerase GalE [Defluviitaleaceae bacterium]|nr:UDP-glucose 4-epimerase GalE [Defluviitaleaceae bacterium]